MKCKGKEFIATGIFFDGRSEQYFLEKLHIVVTNDEIGKTMSVDNGTFKFSIPMDEIAKYLV